MVHPFLMGLLRGADPATLPAPTPADWEAIVSDAATHGFTPLLHRRLRGSEIGGQLPAGLAERLEAQAAGSAARNLILADELASILRAFDERKLACAPLRGLALAERLYGDITARPMGDIDLLVRKADLADVGGLLRSLGFAEMDRRPGFARAFSYTLKFFKDRHGWIIVEPHWTLTYPPFVDRLETDQLLARCLGGQVVGLQTRVLPADELLFHLCLHLTHRDGTAPLLWYYEIDQLLRREAALVDWSWFLSLAHQTRLEFLLGRVLGTVRALFATPMPDPLLDRLRLERPRSLEGRLLRLLAQGSRVDGVESLGMLFALKGLRAKLRYALALLAPSPEFMLLQYGLTRRRQLGAAYARRVCGFGREAAKGATTLLLPPGRRAAGDPG
ncbi:MAG: nucleotidyltransferase family protein [Candidatus Rokubacteria bacterium]|nr:nucleotidyltransferase family protein [Candidatus Rokubacteria bacterium]